MVDTSKKGNSILLYCGTNGSDKEYFIELVSDFSDLTVSIDEMAISYGPRNKVRYSANKPYTFKDFSNIVCNKIKGGYMISRVNGKPFLANDAETALRIATNTVKWDNSPTAQPVQMIKIRDLLVTVNPGQIAPIW
jgi:hypothetical protein